MDPHNTRSTPNVQQLVIKLSGSGIAEQTIDLTTTYASDHVFTIRHLKAGIEALSGFATGRQFYRKGLYRLQDDEQLSASTSPLDLYICPEAWDAAEPSEPNSAPGFCIAHGAAVAIDLYRTDGSPLRPEETECPICQHDLTEDEATYTHETCRYSMHVGCLDVWIGENLNDGTTRATCPMDRQPYAFHIVRKGNHDGDDSDSGDSNDLNQLD
ncbi:hypothetical protein PMZ80_002601 [Knufia obscura]|uniref:RING-type domain-containing protein n=1 Tax=Knufia obscura TaxID=1635080 RepID=A0ABR0RXT1_9EURO|nr:hypothetical protein PMZ80_002601 [Knufia obscura]